MTLGKHPTTPTARKEVLGASKLTEGAQLEAEASFGRRIVMGVGRAHKSGNGVSTTWVSVFCSASFFLGVLVVNRFSLSLSLFLLSAGSGFEVIGVVMVVGFSCFFLFLMAFSSESNFDFHTVES